MSGEDVAYVVKVNQPSLPKGEPVQIPGLGTFENGTSYEVSKDEANAFRTYHTRQIPVYGDDGSLTGSDLELGPTLLQASERMYGVEVSTPGSTPSRGSDASGANTGDKPKQTDEDNKPADEGAKNQSNDGGDK